MLYTVCIYIIHKYILITSIYNIYILVDCIIAIIVDV